MQKIGIILGIVIFGVVQKVQAETKPCQTSDQITVCQKENSTKKYDFDTLALLETISANQHDYQKLLEGGSYALTEVSVTILPKQKKTDPLVVQFTFLAKKIVSPDHSEQEEYQGERKLVLQRTEDQSWKHDTEEMPVYRWKSLGVIQTKQPKIDPKPEDKKSKKPEKIIAGKAKPAQIK